MNGEIYTFTRKDIRHLTAWAIMLGIIIGFAIGVNINV